VFIIRYEKCEKGSQWVTIGEKTSAGNDSVFVRVRQHRKCLAGREFDQVAVEGEVLAKTTSLRAKGITKWTNRTAVQSGSTRGASLQILRSRGIGTMQM
jgi:predicted amidophosphoribosyltransferase